MAMDGERVDDSALGPTRRHAKHQQIGALLDKIDIARDEAGKSQQRVDAANTRLDALLAEARLLMLTV